MPLDTKTVSPSSSNPFRSHNGRRKEPGSPQGQQQGITDDEGTETVRGPSKIKRFSSLSSKTKAKTKKLFRVDDAGVDTGSESEVDGASDFLEHDTAFHTGALAKKKRFRAGKSTDKTLNTIKSLGQAVVHPVESIKGKVTHTTAAKLSKADRPFMSQKHDKDYLQAHDNLRRAESSSSSRQGTSDEEQQSIIGEHRNKLQVIDAQRESLRVAWTTSRHVRRVRVVPKRHIDFPGDDFFKEKDEREQLVRYKWLMWLGYNLVYYTQDFSAQYIDDFDELPFDVDCCRLYIERLVMASAPWQSWAMSVRAVYRWETPTVTAKWFAVYLLLWYTQHVMGFLYCYIIYLVIKNRIRPTSVEAIRESMRVAEDSKATATKFGELIDKHGSREWLGPVMSELGPYAQLQLGDMANMLEVFSNFYHWKYPNKTIATLSFLTACLLVSIFADMAFCMKIVWFIAGGSFFLCWPIASLYPKYRYLASPVKWVLWDIPTHAEWSFQHLRRQAQTAREHIIEKKIEDGHYREIAKPVVDRYTGRMTTTVPRIKVQGDESAIEDSEDDDDGWYSASSTTSILEASDIRSFRAQSYGSIGRLIVYSKGIRYVRSGKKKEVWRCDFLDLKEMRKVDKTTSLFPDELEIKCIDASESYLAGVKERDDAFNTIIAFSNLQWQSLQIKSGSNAQA